MQGTAGKAAAASATGEGMVTSPGRGIEDILERNALACRQACFDGLSMYDGQI